MFEGAFSEALKQAESSLRPLLVFLHSELHEDADEFVLRGLGTAEVCGVLRCGWGASAGYLVLAHSRHDAPTYTFGGW